ncbi:MAG: exodeoxyribonuclease V subunit alpha [Thermodesulfobacteriota bacterium]|nr:exodeoxyribonuclease V subunit alpha [Thermodesulfobacteriota bacterium]
MLKNPLKEAETFEAIDLHFAAFIQKIAGCESGLVHDTTALLSKGIRQGNTCLDLKAILEPNEIDTLRGCSAVGMPGEIRPLILDNTRLYFKRYHDYETSLASRLIDLGSTSSTPGKTGKDNKEILDMMFKEENTQRLSAINAMEHPLCVITGGPGTGKTHTIAGILVMLLMHDPDTQCVLAAPTGKAANRLQESLQQTIASPDLPGNIVGNIPKKAVTIHRMLGFRQGSVSFRYNAQNPMPWDVVVVDEASMIDLALMSKLVDALKADARLILVGDKDQLASVETGYCLGDICAAGADPASVIKNNITELKENHRFKSDSGIYALSAALNKGEVTKSINILSSDQYPDVKKTRVNPNDLRMMLEKQALPFLKDLMQENDIKKRFDLWGQFRILCALRKGQWGFENINRIITDILAAKGLIQRTQNYHGRPILITANDYSLPLFNGDTGMIMDKPGGPKAVFPDSDGAFREISLSRLPPHEDAYAMSIHKSQGSEVDMVLMVLPHNDSKILTKELVYTGITRAKKQIEIWSTDEILKASISRPIGRGSGLYQALLKKKGSPTAQSMS